MGTLAYEMAEEGDYSVLKEIHTLLSDPFSEQSDELSRSISPDSRVGERYARSSFYELIKLEFIYCIK